MNRLVDWLWTRGIVSTFLAGLFALLPIVITVAIVTWVAGKIHSLLGPTTTIGRTLRSIGLRLVTDEVVASVIGWCLVLVGVWLVGLLVRTSARHQLERLIDVTFRRIPFVKGIYGTASQLVGMLNKQDQSELKGMSVVYCAFGERHGGGFLALLASPDVYVFQGRQCRVVYIPTSPLPMSGGIVFVPLEAVTKIDMSAESLMQIYFSLGVLTSQVVPGQYHAPQVA